MFLSAATSSCSTRSLEDWDSLSEVSSQSQSPAQQQAHWHDRLHGELRELSRLEPERIAMLADRARSRSELGRGHEADVYRMPHFDTLVLRCHRDSELYPMPEGGLRYVPVDLDLQAGALAAQPDVGLPRAVLVETEHPVHGRIAVGEITRAYPKILYFILNRCDGASIAQLVSRDLVTFTRQYQHEHEIPATATSAARTLPMQAHWQREYQRRMLQYLSHIDRIATLPQETFDTAVQTLKTIGDSPQVHMSLSHGGNTLLDLQQQRINFVDLNMNGVGSRPSLEALAMVLFGVHRGTAPWKNSYEEAYAAELAQSSEPVLHKLHQAAKKCDMPWHTVDSHPHPQVRVHFEDMLSDLAIENVTRFASS